MSGKLIDFMRKSKLYKSIVDHRRSCNKWQKDFCKKCFGNGLTEFLENLDVEYLKKEKGLSGK